FAFFPIGLMLANSGEVVGVENKSDRVTLVENIAVPDTTNDNLALLIGKKDIRKLSMGGAKNITLPIFDLPSRKVGELVLFANRCRYRSDGCGCLAVIVDRDDQHLSAIRCRAVVSATGYVRAFRDGQVLDRSLQLEALPAEYDQLESRDPGQSDGGPKKSCRKISNLLVGGRFDELLLMLGGGLLLWGCLLRLSPRITNDCDQKRETKECMSRL